MECPKCRHGNPDGAKFCNECGNDLSRLSTPTAKTAAPAPQGERRQATVVISDLSGYTAMNERLDPEEVEAVMRRVKGEAVRIVEAQGGIVNQFVGDEVLALFGIPIAHEDDPRRAVQAALDVHQMVRTLSAEVEGRIGAPLRMHTGINTGLVVTHLRDDREGRYGITGDTVNTCARLAAQAEADTILAGPETHRFISAYFETEPLQPVRVKGKAEPVTPHRVLAATAVQTRFDAARSRGLSPYLGRADEMETLRNKFALAGAGQGQAVALVAEAGLGKSRVIHEFQRGLDLEAVNLVVGHCASTGASHSYHLFRDLIRRWFEIADEDTPADMAAKIEAGARALEPTLVEHLPALYHLLSIPGDLAFPPAMAAEAIQRKVVAALLACLIAAARDKTLVLICEDLHWLDPNSETILHRYLQAIPSHKALLLLSYRPEYRPAWGALGHMTELHLRPLPANATAAILAASFGVQHLPEGLAERVHACTEGSPFFNEEVALSLVGEGLVECRDGSAVLTRPITEIAFPDTVQAVVRERIDRLPDAPREVLRLASVVGREFAETLVKKIHSEPDRVGEDLGELRSQELILEKRLHPELEFMFKHAITHDVSYATLLVSRRKTLHRLVGAAIEELYGERLPEFHEMLAYHFDRGQVWDKAVDYLIKAGMKSQKNSAIMASLDYFDRAMEIIDKQQPELPWQILFDLRFSRGLTYIDLGKWKFTAQEMKVALEIARRGNDKEREARALLMGAQASIFAYDVDDAIRLLGELEQVVAGNPDKLMPSTALQGLLHFHLEEVEKAVVSAKETEEYFRLAPNSPFILLGSFFVAMNHRLRGDFKKCSNILGPITSRAKEAATTEFYMRTMFFYGLALGEQGRFQQAIDVLREAENFGIEAGERYSTMKVTNSLGWVYHELCMYREAIDRNTEAIEILKESLGPGTSSLFEIECMTLVNLGENNLMAGELDTAAEFLERVFQNSQKPEYYWARARWKPRCLLALGELHLTRGNPGEAQGFLDQAIEHGWIEKFPYKKYQVRAQRLQGNILTAQGNLEQAETALKRALKLARALGSPTQLWLTDHALATLYAGLANGGGGGGDGSKGKSRAKNAAKHYRAALDTVQAIALGLTEPELKEGFLTSAPIRQLMAQAEQT